MSSKMSIGGTPSCSGNASQETDTTPGVTTDSPNATFAFLVHSQDTLTNGLPPNADNPPISRSRRRRTRYAHVGLCNICCYLTKYSPEDHAILETEYQLNSKPDKIARLSIVKRVALGEKEVQVCPLVPNDIRSLLLVYGGACHICVLRLGNGILD